MALDNPMEFVGLADGEFTMGSRLGDGEFIEHPRHRVSLSPFFIARTEVTQEQYAEVMGSNPSYHQGSGDLPVDGVSWCEAIRFANEMSDGDPEMEAVYEVSEPENEWEGCSVTWDKDTRGYRLPTEAEWEFAASALVVVRSGEVTVPTGGAPIATAWFKANADQTTHEVAALQPSGVGLHDMFGNVQEWVWDEFAPYGSGHVFDPVGPIANEDPWRIVRGGHALDREKDLRTTRRVRKIPTAQYRFDGLRLALTVFDDAPEVQAANPSDGP